MTNKEYLIDKLWEHHEYVDRKTIEVIFDAYNKKDWAVFCSQMGDYDHPYERVLAKQKLEEELDKITHPFGSLSYPVLEAVEAVRQGLEYDNETSRFYHKHFHTMDEEHKTIEACKICDNNCGFCKFDCNCSTEVEIE